MSNSRNSKNKTKRNIKVRAGVDELSSHNNNSNLKVEITSISQKGNGVGHFIQQYQKQTNMSKIYVPKTLPGEIVRVRPNKKSGKRIDGDLIEVIITSPERQLPRCNSYLDCGGCQLQHMDYVSYLRWKRNSTLEIFRKSEIEVPKFDGLIASNDQKRRRATFKFKKTQQKSYIGFLKSGTHQIIPLVEYVVLSAELLKTKQNILEGLDKTMPIGTELSIQVNQYETGSDILITTDRKLSNIVQVELASWACNTEIRRISLCHNGEIEKRLIYQNSPPSITWFGIEIKPPPGSFLQPTVFGEEILQKQILFSYKDMENCLDLFSGIGTLSASLLAQEVRITAIDSHKECLNAYKLGYQRANQNNLLKTEIRNLMEAPLLCNFLNNFQGIIIDPPRGGACSQIKQIAMSDCPSVTYVSCNPFSFVNDAKILMQGGYRFKNFKLLDQFSWTAHIEVIGNFEKK